MTIRPIVLREARRFVAEHHRHNEPPHAWLFGVGLYDGDELRGVGIAARPKARHMDDGLTVEIIRVCTLSDRNAASRLYGALCRAAKALGYVRAITYTLAEETGVSLRAAGFIEVGRTESHDGWKHGDGALNARFNPRLWEAAKMPTGPKVRWARELVA